MASPSNAQAQEDPVARMRRARAFTLLQARQTARTKFTKWQAYFVAQGRGRAQCTQCAWWLAPNTQPDGVPRCLLVDEHGEPSTNMIPGGAACALWNAGPARIRTQRVIRGRGASHGIAPGNLRVRIERTLVPPPWTGPPPAVQERLVLPTKTIPP